MDPATAHFKKFCPDLKTVGETDVPCSTGYEYYNGICFKILEELEFVYSQAELGCLPEPNSPYRSQIIWTENIAQYNHISLKVKEKLGVDSYWAGISDKDKTGFYTSSLGHKITTSSKYFDSSENDFKTCGLIEKSKSGYVTTGDCESKRATGKKFGALEQYDSFLLWAFSGIFLASCKTNISLNSTYFEFSNAPSPRLVLV